MLDLPIRMFRPCQGTHQRLITNAQYAIHMPFVTGRLCNWESSCDIWPDCHHDFDACGLQLYDCNSAEIEIPYIYGWDRGTRGLPPLVVLPQKLKTDIYNVLYIKRNLISQSYYWHNFPLKNLDVSISPIHICTSSGAYY